MAQANDLSGVLKQGLEALLKCKKSAKDYVDDKKMVELLTFVYDTAYYQIHTYLTGLNNTSGEKQIRSCIRDIVGSVLPICYDKLWRNQRNDELAGKYLKLYDDFYALVAFRSLEHFAQYMEFDKTDAQKLWKPTLHLFKGFWYYANQMVLDGSVKFISKQCFTGLGKTYSNAILLSFIYGNDINADALYVFGASENVGTFTMGLVDLMTSDRYAKVFPYYQQFKCEDREMTANATFMVRQAKDTGAKLRISGSSKPVNLRVVSKDKNTNGVRAKFLFLDDIAQFADANNPNAHKKDRDRLDNEWFKRNYNRKEFYVIAGGTTYNTEDILSYLLEKNNIDEAKTSIIGGKEQKFTKVAKSNYVISGGTAVFICVPKLDYDTDESVYPEKYPTEDARRDRDNALDDGRMFDAMEQQRPRPSDEAPFDWGNIHLYDYLPPDEFNGGTRQQRCRFSIDPSRKGKDACAMLVFSKDGEREYLVDGFLDKQPLDHKYEDGTDVIDKFCELIIRHKCYEGIAEENTASNLSSQITDRLAKYGYNGCKVKGFFSTMIKRDKISSVSGTIQSYIWFPARKVFAPNSMVGRIMRDITTWTYEKNKADDAPECCSTYCKEYIKQDTLVFKQIGTFKR
jgi:hypothetical protein